MQRVEVIRNMDDQAMAEFFCELLGPDGCAGCPFWNSGKDVVEVCGVMSYLHEEMEMEW